MRHAHAAADGHVPADELAVFDDGDEAAVMREDVNVVVRRHREDELEFARQIARTVNRLAFRRRGLLSDDLLSVQPDLVIGAGLRQHVSARPLRELVGFLMNLRKVGICDRHDAASDVATRRDRVETCGVDRLHRAFEVRFDDAMKLERRPRRHAQRMVRIRHRRCRRAAATAPAFTKPPGIRNRIMNM